MQAAASEDVCLQWRTNGVEELARICVCVAGKLSWRYGSPVSRVVNHVGPVHIVDAEKDTVADDI